MESGTPGITVLGIHGWNGLRGQQVPRSSTVEETDFLEGDGICSGSRCAGDVMTNPDLECQSEPVYSVCILNKQVAYSLDSEIECR